MNPLNELADLFDKLADAWTAAPAEVPAPEPKTAARVEQASATESPAHKLASLVHSATGETLPSDVAERIASDSSLLEHVTKLAESGARPNSLGEPVDRSGTSAPLSRREKVASAWERWNNNVRNNG